MGKAVESDGIIPEGQRAVESMQSRKIFILTFL